MWKPLCLGLAFSCVTGTGAAQEDDPWADPESGWQTEGGIEAVLAGAADTDAPVWLVALNGEANRVLDSGVEIGVAGWIEAVQEIEPLPEFAGGPLGGPSGRTEADARFEQAFLFVSGGYGEARLGLDRGIARRFSVQPPTVFTQTAMGAPRLSVTGAETVRTDHDLTGPAAKVSYASPRLLGLQVGASFAPEANADEADQSPVQPVPGAPGWTTENATELGLNLSRKLGGGAIEVNAGLGWSQADLVLQGAGGTSEAETWSAGLSVAGEHWAAGAAWIESDPGARISPDSYRAFTLGATARWGAYELGAGYGEAENGLAGIDSTSRSLGIVREFGEHLTGAVGWRAEKAKGPPAIAPVPPQFDPSRSGIVIEITLSL